MSFGFGVGDFIAVIDKLRHCHDRFSEAPELFVSLVSNVKIIGPLLEDARQPQHDLSDNEQQILEGIIDGSYTDLKRLKQILDDCNGLQKPLEKKTWDKANLVQFLHRLKLDPKTINGIQSSLTIKIQLLNTLKSASGSRVIQGTKQVVDLMHHEQISQHQQEILEWLTPSDYSLQQRDYFSTRHPETASWLLESREFEWVSNKGQTLLCRGMPGAGKTIMTSVVIDHLIHRFRDDPSIGIAYIYFNFKDTERQGCHDIISSLTKQLAQSCSSFPKSLETLYDTHQKHKTLRSTKETIDLLHALSSTYDRVFVIIDALDECGRNTRLDFLPEMFRLQQDCRVNIFATTRDITEILQSKELKTSVAVEIRARKEDVLKYVEGRITHMQSFVRDNDYLQKEIGEVIATKVDGMFLLARLLIDAWSNKLNPKGLKEALKVFEATEGNGNVYSAVYNEALKRIESQPSEHMELALKILSWITGAKRPLKILELQHALAIEEGKAELDQENITPDEVMVSVCAGLITISEESGVVRLVHQTTQEYFEGIRHQLFPDIDTQIAVACINYISMEDLNGIPKISASVDSAQQEGESSAPFFSYAVRHFGEHARSCPIVPIEVVKFLENHDLLERSLLRDRYRMGLERGPRTWAQVAAWFGIIQLFTSPTVGNLPEYEIYSTDERGTTALWWAVDKGWSDIVKFYVDNDAIEGPFLATLSKPPRTFKWRVSRQSLRSVMRVAFRNKREDVLKELFKVCTKRSSIGNLDHDNQASIFLDFPDLSRRSLRSKLKHGVKHGEKPLFSHNKNPCLSIAGWRAIFYFLDSLKDDDDDDYDLGWIPLLFALFHDCNRQSENRTYLRLQDRLPYLEHSRVMPSDDKIGRLPYEGISFFDEALAETAGILLSLGAELDVVDYRGRTPLAQAILLGLQSVVEVLLLCGASTETRDDNGDTPLSLAIKAKNWMALLVLVEHGTSIEAQYCNKKDLGGRTLMSLAAQYGRVVVLRLLTDGGADFRTQDADGRTPMYWAIVSGSTHALEFLLKIGADKEDCGFEGSGPLTLAAINDQITVIELLIDYGVNIEAIDVDGRTPLSWAASQGKHAAVQFLLQRGSLVDAYDKNGWTALAWACTGEAGSNDVIIQTLLANGARTGIDHSNLLWFYVQENFSLTIVHALCQSNSGLCLKDEKGRTLLHYAAYHGSANDFQLILESTGLNLNTKDYNNRTPLWYAVEKMTRRWVWDETADRVSCKEVIRLILDEPGVDTHICNGQEALRTAICVDDLDAIRLLITHKLAVVNGVCRGEFPMTTAARKRNFPAFMFLLASGARWAPNQHRNVQVLSENLWRFWVVDIWNEGYWIYQSIPCENGVFPFRQVSRGKQSST